MVRAILDGRKTVTRRVVKSQHREPPYRPGDILYVRETWCDPSGTGYPFLYKADMPMHWDAGDTEIGVPIDLKAEDYMWRPSIHMPKEAARLFLRVTNVRVERLQNIDDVQACEEGAEGDPCDCDGSEVFCSRCCNTGWLTSPRSKFEGIWNSTIKPTDRALYGWEANPWVWVIEVERIKKEEAEHG